jgi:hypothetical protein
MSVEQATEVVGRADADEASLDYTQGIRRQLIGILMTDVKAVADPKVANSIGGLLDGMDRQALGKMKIRVEEAQVINQEGMATNIAEILKQMGSGGHNFQAAEPVPREVPKLGSDVPDPILVDGEVATTPIQQDFDSFHAQFTPEDAN